MTRRSILHINTMMVIISALNKLIINTSRFSSLRNFRKFSSSTKSTETVDLPKQRARRESRYSLSSVSNFPPTFRFFAGFWIKEELGESFFCTRTSEFSSSKPMNLFCIQLTYKYIAKSLLTFNFIKDFRMLAL